jgi:methionyl-tRNA formyltransferase
MIRAVTHPYPGAFVDDGAARLYLWEGAPGRAASAAAPGTIVALHEGEGVTVATGEGTLRLTRIQQAGRHEETADRWATGRGLRPGDRMAAR